MNPFEYLSVMISVVLGLALTELATLASGLVMHRERVRWDWIPPAWALLVFLAILQWWWHFFRWSDYDRWTFGMYAALACQPLVIFQAVRALLPHPRAEGPLDLRGHFEHNCTLFYALGLCSQTLDLVIVVIGRRLPLAAVLSEWTYTAFFAIFAVGIFARRRTMHVALILLAWLAYGYVTLAAVAQPLHG